MTSQRSETPPASAGIPFAGGEAVLDSFIELNYHLREIRSTVDQQILTLEAAKRPVHAEKWRYLRNLIEGPILTARKSAAEHPGQGSKRLLAAEAAHL